MLTTPGEWRRSQDEVIQLRVAPVPRFLGTGEVEPGRATDAVQADIPTLFADYFSSTRYS